VVAEELQKNTLWELYKVSKFVNFPVTFKRMWCVQYNDKLQRSFLREKPEWMKPEILYSDVSKQNMNRALEELIHDTTLQKYNMRRILESYMLH